MGTLFIPNLNYSLYSKFGLKISCKLRLFFFSFFWESNNRKYFLFISTQLRLYLQAAGQLEQTGGCGRLYLWVQLLTSRFHTQWDSGLRSGCGVNNGFSGSRSLGRLPTGATKLTGRCSQVNFTSTNTLPSETQGKPLKIKATVSLKNTERASLTLLYSAKPFGVCALFVCWPIPRLIFPLPPRKQNESSAITKDRGGRGRAGRDCHKYLFAGLGNLCNSLWISKVIWSVWMIYTGRAGCHICQPSTRDHLRINV